MHGPSPPQEKQNKTEIEISKGKQSKHHKKLGKEGGEREREGRETHNHLSHAHWRKSNLLFAILKIKSKITLRKEKNIFFFNKRK